MLSRLVQAHAICIKDIDLDAAARRLRSGGVIIFPTETFYALGCLALQPDAVALIYQLKHRSLHTPLPLLAADMAQANTVADLQALPQELQAFWPGPLTVLLPAHPCVPTLLRNKRGHVAVRVTSHPLAASLARRSGGVLTASSANRSGLPAVCRVEALDTDLLAEVSATALGTNFWVSDDDPAGPILRADGVQPAGGLPSTIVEPVPGPDFFRLRILREGAVSTAMLARYFAIENMPPSQPS